MWDDAMDDLKEDVADDTGVPLKEDGDNGDLTARQLGTVGGNMVKRLVKLGKHELRERDDSERS